MNPGNIGIFDSGIGGLTVMRSIVDLMPEYNYCYLGDNARAPYGTRSYETVFEYTWQGVQWLIEKANCNLVILACNTASAKALRTIQQKYLAQKYPGKNVLGVIRPTAEVIGNYSKTNSIGIMATAGTVQSESYLLEIKKFFPQTKVHQQACPMLVPIIENREQDSEGARFFMQKYVGELLKKSPDMDTVLLGCTHFPIIKDALDNLCKNRIQFIGQGEIVAKSLRDYLHRHAEMESTLQKQRVQKFYTTENTAEFDAKASLFYKENVQSEFVDLV